MFEKWERARFPQCFETSIPHITNSNILLFVVRATTALQKGIRSLRRGYGWSSCATGSYVTGKFTQSDISDIYPEASSDSIQKLRTGWCQWRCSFTWQRDTVPFVCLFQLCRFTWRVQIRAWERVRLVQMCTQPVRLSFQQSPEYFWFPFSEFFCWPNSDMIVLTTDALCLSRCTC